ncbi:hypothetical protein RFI_08106 [Reticulomyxa filosa]|uniref:Uncharacterized protein n=1 Tax=Reticulomyxa filosa TaxID=46433 RepID=X6NRW1_RETFI|nr:hypothetical protein RFI_08106 [Reticulomyxa filosa]|eukprot:ETO29020.1 hypothetical protein RFI_08106 [Reticulomyxa filosa]
MRAKPPPPVIPSGSVGAKGKNSRGIAGLMEYISRREGVGGDPSVMALLERINDTFNEHVPDVQKMLDDRSEDIQRKMLRTAVVKRRAGKNDTQPNTNSNQTTIQPHPHENINIRRGTVKSLRERFDHKAQEKPATFRRTRKNTTTTLSIPDGNIRHRRRVSGGIDIQSLKQGHFSRQGSLGSDVTSPAMAALGGPSDIANSSQLRLQLQHRESSHSRDSSSYEYSQTLITTTEGEADPLDQLRKILQKEPNARTDEDVDVMVDYFDNYRIMSEDIDIYSGKSTFRAFIQETRYRKYQPNKQIFEQGELGNEFYFILTGKVSVLVNEDVNDTDNKDGASNNPDPNQQHEQHNDNQDDDDNERLPKDEQNPRLMSPPSATVTIHENDDNPDDDDDANENDPKKLNPKGGHGKGKESGRYVQPRISAEEFVARVEEEEKQNQPKQPTFGIWNATSSSSLPKPPKRKEVAVLTSHDLFGELAVDGKDSRRAATCACQTIVEVAYWTRETYDRYIRPLKDNKRKALQVLFDKNDNMLGEEELTQKAALFLDDVMQKRPLKMHRTSKWPQMVHHLTNSTWFTFSMYLTSMLLLGLILLEPPCFGDYREGGIYKSRIGPLLAVEWLFFFIFLMECLLRVYSFGSKWFLDTPVHKGRIVALTIFGLDLLIATSMGGRSFRFSRVFRPMFLNIAVDILIMAVFARAGIHMFKFSKDLYVPYNFTNGLSPYTDLKGNCDQIQCFQDKSKCCNVDPTVFQSFDSFARGMASLYVLMTTENYPDIFWPTWMNGHFYWTYFLVFLLLVTFFLMNLFSAAMYDAFYHILSNVVWVEEERSESEALQAAWTCLDRNLSGKISLNKFKQLMKYLKPNYTDVQNNVLFSLLGAAHKDDEIDEEQFSINIVSVMYLNITKVKPRAQSRKELLKKCPCCSKQLLFDIIRAFESQYYNALKCLLIVLDCLVLLIYHDAYQACWVIDTVMAFLFAVLTICEIVFVHSLTWRLFWPESLEEGLINKVEFVVGVVHLGSACIGLYDDKAWITVFRFVALARASFVAKFLFQNIRGLRSSMSHVLTRTFLRMLPVFFGLVFAFSVGLMYVFTVVGMELFNDSNKYGKNRCDESGALNHDPTATFCDAQMTIITLFHIFCSNNWNVDMFSAVKHFNNNMAVSIYFILFHFSGPIFMLNMLLAVFFEMYFEISQTLDSDLTAAFVDEFDNITDKSKPKDERGDTQKQDEDKEGHSDNNAEGDQKHTTIELANNSKGNSTDANVDNNGDVALKDIAKQLRTHLELRSFVLSDGQIFEKTFTGTQAVDYLVSNKLAPDKEEAVDTLTQLISQEMCAQRVDPGAPNEFENIPNSHYKWIDDVDEESANIHIGLKQSYGGYQHIMKRTHTIEKMQSEMTKAPGGLKRARTVGNLLVDNKKTPVPNTTGDKDNNANALDTEKANDSNEETVHLYKTDQNQGPKKRQFFFVF